MLDFDLFGLYRRVLLIVVGTYSFIRLIHGIWRWRMGTQRSQRKQVLLRRWVELSVLRVRMRRFTFDILQIVLLMVLLGAIGWVQVR
ncbi:MAG: hypothetical protein GY842_03405 [bacterium]|nr:hypothetical protein [bacterium]